MKTKYITFLNHNFTINKEIIFDYLFYSKSYNTNIVELSLNQKDTEVASLFFPIMTQERKLRREEKMFQEGGKVILIKD